MANLCKIHKGQFSNVTFPGNAPVPKCLKPPAAVAPPSEPHCSQTGDDVDIDFGILQAYDTSRLRCEIKPREGNVIFGSSQIVAKLNLFDNIDTG